MRREVVEQASKGDRRAFETLAASVLDRLFGAAILILHDRTNAEDAVQETLIRTWRDLPRLREPDRFDPWIHSVLVHACLDLARHERRNRLELEVPAWITDEAEGFETDLADRDAIGRALARLHPRERAVLVLRFFLGMTPPQIAEALRVPVGTAKSRLHNAQGAMRAAIDADTRLAMQGGVA
jgi:RNA polymerase sigma-70 factor (ECF subfamily)